MHKTPSIDEYKLTLKLYQYYRTNLENDLTPKLP